MSRICQFLLALGLIGILYLAETGKINLSARPEKKGTVAADAAGNAPAPPVADGNGPGPDPEGLLRQADNHDDRDEAQAIFLLSKAADLGNAEAQYRLARCCFVGEGTAESDAGPLFHLLMYEALRDLRNRSTPLPEVEAALKRCCIHLLPPSIVKDVRQRRDKELAAIRQRMTAR